MRLLRSVAVFAFSALPSVCATYGTVVAHPTPLADLALDEARRRLYVVNTAFNQVEVYSTASNPPRLTDTIKTDSTPLAIALSRGRAPYLYVACYSASSLEIIDLTSAEFASRSVSLPASPQALAVGFDDKVLISTIGTGTGQNVLMTFDPGADAQRALQGIAIAPPAPSAPTLPPPNGAWAMASHARLQASGDGGTIIGAHLLANNTRSVFVYDVASSTVLRSRNLAAISPVLAVAPDGSRFLSGPTLFETSTLLVLGQQNITNSPYTFPAGANFNVQTSQGGAVYADTAEGPALLTAYNIVPVQVPAARPNVSQLLFNSPENLLIRLGVQLPENLSGKMAVTSDGTTVYALSQSGFMVLPLRALSQSPIAVPDSNVALLASDQCGVTAARNSAVIPVRNAGGRNLTATAQVLTPAAASASVRVASRPYGVDVTASISAAAGRAAGTSAPDLLLIQSNEAVNIVPNVRIYQNGRSAEAGGTILPVDIGATNTGLTDIVADASRERLYLANPGLNRIEVFDTRNQEFLSPIAVGQLPRSMALGGDGNTLYVANSGGESISIIDLEKRAVTGSVKYPPIPFNATFALLTPQILASSQRGPQVLMSDGTLWKIVGDTVLPRTLNSNVFGTARSIPAPQSMVATPDGAYVLLLAGNGNAFLFDASIDDFVSGRQVIPTPVTGYYGPVAAGPGGLYFLTNDQVLNQALTPVGSAGGAGQPSRPVAAVAAAGAQSFARFSTAPRTSATAAAADAGMVELVDANTLRVTATAKALESPLTAAIGTARAIVAGRTMVVDAVAGNAYVLTASGLSIVPLAPVAAQAVPQIQGSVVNAANFTAQLAPGGLISIMGRNLAATETASTTPLPGILGNTCVTLNNAPLPLLATTGGQINAQIPFTVAAGRYPLVVRSIGNQAASNSVTVTVSKYAPAVFFDEKGAAIFHADGRRVNKENPGSRDEPLVIYATGLGVTTGGPASAGNPAPSDPLAVTGPVRVYFGDPTIKQTEVIVDWSGLMPGQIGVYQINCRIPGFHWKGDALPVTIRIGGVSSPVTGATTPVVYVD